MRQRITEHRAQHRAALARVARPFAWIAGVADWWRQLSPTAKCILLPVSVVVVRVLCPKGRGLRRLLGWMPLIVSLLQEMGRARAAERPSDHAPCG